MNIEEKILWYDSLYKINFPEIDNDELVRFTKDKQKNEPVSVSRSNIGGWQNDIFRNENAEFDKLFHKLDYVGNEIFYNKYCFDVEIRITNAWLNVNRKHDYNAEHTHPGAVLSGVYYIKTENTPDQGNIHFNRNNESKFVAVPSKGSHTHLAWKFSHWETPKVSEAYLFPPWYTHNVLANNLDEERISVAFNFQAVNNFRDNIHNMSEQIYK